MSGKNFYKLSLWEKTLIAIGAFSTVMGGLYYFFHWLDLIIEKLNLNTTASVKVIVGLIFLFVGMTLTFLILYTNSVLPYILELLKKLRKGESQIIIPTEKKEFDYAQNKEYKFEFGEIAAYWGNRNAANIRIKDLLKSSIATDIFIAAIGFSTIKVLDDTEVVNHFAELINNNIPLRITIVSPLDIGQLKNARPEISQSVLQEKFESGQYLLKTFKGKLLNQLKDKNSFDKHIKFKSYNNNTIPRHFILQDNKSIFFGSYLSSETGSNSYLIELHSNNQISTKNELTGLYNLFINEIENIKTNSVDTTF